MNSGDADSLSNVTDPGKENVYNNSEEPGFGNSSYKNCSPISTENSSLSGLPACSCQYTTLDSTHTFADVKPCQGTCKRLKRTDENTWLYSDEEHSFSIGADTTTSAFTDGFVEAGEPDHICANNGAIVCSTSSGTPYPNCEQPIGEESYLPDWVTSFPGYFEDPVARCNQVDDIDSHDLEFLPRKAVAIGPDHQAVIPEWRPRFSKNFPGVSVSCSDLPHNSVPISPGDEYTESDKWTRHCIIPMPYFSSCVNLVQDYKTDCECSYKGSIRCARQHVMEARETLKKNMGEEKFHELGLCEMGEHIARRWTSEEEKLFHMVVSSNPVSSGKNFWDYLPHALPGKTSKELVSYYFNVFMLRKRGQQNMSDLLHVDSDDDESPGGLTLIEQEDKDPAMKSPTCGHYIDNVVATEDVHKEFGEQFHKSSLPEKVIDNVPEFRHGPKGTVLETNLYSIVDVDIQDKSLQIS